MTMIWYQGTLNPTIYLIMRTRATNIQLKLSFQLSNLRKCEYEVIVSFTSVDKIIQYIQVN